MNVIDILWQRAESVLFISKEQFLASLDGWEIEPVEHDGVVLLITLTKGPELHFTSLDTGHPIPMGVVRAVVQKILDKHGHVIVKTPKLEGRQQRFNKAIGFVQIGEDEYDIHYRLDQFGRHRSAPCPSLQ